MAPNVQLSDELIKAYERNYTALLREHEEDVSNMKYDRRIILLVREIIKNLGTEPCPLSEETLKSIGIDRGTMPRPTKTISRKAQFINGLKQLMRPVPIYQRDIKNVYPFLSHQEAILSNEDENLHILTEPGLRIHRVNWPTITLIRPYPKLKMGLSEDYLETANVIPLDFYASPSHRLELRITDDKNGFPVVEQTQLLLPRVATMHNMLTRLNKTIPVIGFFDNCSIICAYSEDHGRYGFLKAWNGVYGKDLVLSFETDSPKLVDNIDSLNEHFVVYDLIKIMAQDPSDLEKDPVWKFRITKDEFDPVLIEITLKDGEVVRETPSSLMGMMITEHMNVYEKETGTKPDALGFYLCDHFESDAIERIKEQLYEACSWSNDVEFHFISWY